MDLLLHTLMGRQQCNGHVSERKNFKRVKESGANGNNTDQVSGKMMVRTSGMASTDQTRLDRERESLKRSKKLVQIHLCRIQLEHVRLGAAEMICFQGFHPRPLLGQNVVRPGHSSQPWQVRVAKVLRWLQNKHWMHLPFDKLILKLSLIGVMETKDGNEKHIV